MLVLVVMPDEALAGPGGQFVKAAFKTPFIRWILVFLAILLFPLVIYIYVREKLGIRRTKADLAGIARRHPVFAWPKIKAHVMRAIRDIHRVWSTGDLSSVAHYMTEDYYLSQQAMLDRWAEEGKRNVNEVRRINKVQPLHVSVEDDDSLSIISVLVDVKVVDYLENVATGKVVKGNKKPQDGFETIWMFVLVDGQWLLHSIEDGSESLVMAQERNRIDTGYLDRLEAYAPAAAEPEEPEPEEVPRRAAAPAGGKPPRRRKSGKSRRGENDRGRRRQ